MLMETTLVISVMRVDILNQKKTGIVHYLSKSDGCLFKVYECRECGILQRERRNPYEPVAKELNF